MSYNTLLKRENVYHIALLLIQALEMEVPHVKKNYRHLFYHQRNNGHYRRGHDHRRPDWKHNCYYQQWIFNQYSGNKLWQRATLCFRCDSCCPVFDSVLDCMDWCFDQSGTPTSMGLACVHDHFFVDYNDHLSDCGPYYTSSATICTIYAASATASLSSAATIQSPATTRLSSVATV